VIDARVFEIFKMQIREPPRRVPNRQFTGLVCAQQSLYFL